MEGEGGRGWFLRRRGGLIGAAVGFLIALAIKEWGILWTLFVAFAVAVGYGVGRWTDGDREGLAAWIDRLLPPGRR